MKLWICTSDPWRSPCLLRAGGCAVEIVGFFISNFQRKSIEVRCGFIPTPLQQHLSNIEIRKQWRSTNMTYLYVLLLLILTKSSTVFKMHKLKVNTLLLSEGK